MEQSKSELEKIKKILSNAASLVLTVLYIVKSITGAPLDHAIAICAAIIFVSCIFFMKGTFKFATRFFSLCGCILLLLERAPLEVWSDGFNRMLASVIIIVTSQGLAIAIQVGHYDDSVSVFLQKNVKNVFGFFCLMLIISHVLSGTMTMGAIIIIFTAILPLLKKILPDCPDFMAVSVGVGYAALLLWAPSSVSASMSNQEFGITWSSYFIPALLLAIVEMLAGAAFGYIKFGKLKFADVDIREQSDPSQKEHAPIHLVIVLAIMVVVILILEKLKFSNSTGRLGVSAILISAIWMLLISEEGSMRSVPGILWNAKLPSNMESITFFIAMGLFSEAISYVGVERWITQVLLKVSGVLNVGILALLPLLIILASLIGVHPFISIVVLCPIISHIGLSVSPVLLSLSACLGCVITFMVSPFTGSVLVMAAQMNESPTKVSYKYNLIPSVIFYAVGVLYLFAGSLFI